MRHILLPLIVALLPTAIYLLVRLAMAANAQDAAEAEAADGSSRTRRPVPFGWLVGGGVALAVATLVGLALLDPGAPPGGRYEPARLEDGRIVPGRFLDDETPAPAPIPRLSD